MPGELKEQKIVCEGWWEQEAFGRQPMTDLSILFTGTIFQGFGMDIIGPFALYGEVGEGGSVTIGKHYVLGHSIQYSGVYDGEGTMTGYWTNGVETGRWMIVVKRDLNLALDDIREIAP
jgi:hypothetical protein